MVTTARTVVVVGASVAGVRCARALRGEGFAGRIVLVDEEDDTPYDKPPLSKQVLAGTWDMDRARLLTTEQARELGVELRLGSAAVRLDVAGREVHLGDDTVVPFDVVVLATGASARPSPWSCESGVHVLRSAHDARALHEELQADWPVVVVGGGFIGAEVAATARALGRDVTVVDPLPAPIGRVVGADLGDHFTALHHRHGVQTRFGTGVEGVEGRAGDLRVSLLDGSVLHAGTVVVGIGAVPNDGWLDDSGLQVEDGVTCDEYCRATGADDVYVLGDLARWWHPGHREHQRVEHWTNAVDSAVVTAHNIVHPDTPRSHAPVEYVWSDQYDWRIQIAGRPSRGTRHQTVGTWAGDQARAVALFTDESGVLAGAVSVNWPKALVTCRRLLAERVGFDEALQQVGALTMSSSRA